MPWWEHLFLYYEVKMNLFLVLSNRKVFKGKAFGHIAEVFGQVGFTTSMGSDISILSDSVNFAKIIVRSFPYSGITGVQLDMVDKLYPAAYIAKNYSPHFGEHSQLDELLKKHKVVGLYGIDTRTLIKTLRSEGEMNAVLTKNPDTVDFSTMRDCDNKKQYFDLINNDDYTFSNGDVRIAVIDLGVDKNLLQQLKKRNATVEVLNIFSATKALKEKQYDGVVVSDGALQVEDYSMLNDCIKLLFEKDIPTLALGKGCLLLANFKGVEIQKSFSHRGNNYPVADNFGKIFITAQNHQYFLDAQTLGCVKPLYFNVNDKTTEGVQFSKNASGVLFKVGSCGAPKESEFILDDFFSLIARCNNATE